MKKSKLIQIAERYNMEFIRHYITREGEGVYVQSPELIPELDAICDSTEYDNVMGTRELVAGQEYIYKLYCPKSWIDLCGWH